MSVFIFLFRILLVALIVLIIHIMLGSIVDGKPTLMLVSILLGAGLQSMHNALTPKTVKPPSVK